MLKSHVIPIVYLNEIFLLCSDNGIVWAGRVEYRVVRLTTAVLNSLILNDRWANILLVYFCLEYVSFNLDMILFRLFLDPFNSIDALSFAGLFRDLIIVFYFLLAHELSSSIAWVSYFILFNI